MHSVRQKLAKGILSNAIYEEACEEYGLAGPTAAAVRQTSYRTNSQDANSEWHTRQVPRIFELAETYSEEVNEYSPLPGYIQVSFYFLIILIVCV